jgi:hypothetical protein
MARLPCLGTVPILRVIEEQARHRVRQRRGSVAGAPRIPVSGVCSFRRAIGTDRTARPRFDADEDACRRLDLSPILIVRAQSCAQNRTIQ